jgi:hypothetical protein
MGPARMITRELDNNIWNSRTAKTRSGSGAANFAVPHKTVLPNGMLGCRPRPEDKAHETTLQSRRRTS